MLNQHLIFNENIKSYDLNNKKKNKTPIFILKLCKILRVYFSLFLLFLSLICLLRNNIKIENKNRTHLMHTSFYICTQYICAS
jgi:hypothetical protein